MPTDKWGDNNEFGKKTMYNHYRTNCFRQELSMDTKSRKKIWQETEYLHNPKLFSPQITY